MESSRLSQEARLKLIESLSRIAIFFFSIYVYTFFRKFLHGDWETVKVSNRSLGGMDR